MNLKYSTSPLFPGGSIPFLIHCGIATPDFKASRFSSHRIYYTCSAAHGQTQRGAGGRPRAKRVVPLPEYRPYAVCRNASSRCSNDTVASDAGLLPPAGVDDEQYKLLSTDFAEVCHIDTTFRTAGFLTAPDDRFRREDVPVTDDGDRTGSEPADRIPVHCRNHFMLLLFQQGFSIFDAADEVFLNGYQTVFYCARRCSFLRSSSSIFFFVS